MLKAGGSILILAGCLGLGLVFREHFNGRIRALQQLMTLLELLESEVRYGRSVLPECCRRVGEQQKDLLGEALLGVAKDMQANDGASFGEVFRAGMEEALCRLPLKAQDREDFFHFASVSGLADGQMQVRCMEQSLERLARTRKKLEAESADKGRIAVGLGAMSGLLLILILW
jgi:stage III sporulation protein AB